jgi:hypothetical protein
VARGGPRRRSAGERERRARIFVPLGLTLRSRTPWRFRGAFGDDRWGGQWALVECVNEKKNDKSIRGVLSSDCHQIGIFGDDKR